MSYLEEQLASDPAKEVNKLVAKVTRVEVIDDSGRVYGNRPCRVALSLQDDGKTLKVFVTHTE